MDLFGSPVRDVGSLRLPDWGRVCRSDDVVGWQFVDTAGTPVAPVQVFLAELVAQGRSSGTVRTYAYVLQRWWRFLIAVDVAWDRATPAEARDLVLWLRCAVKPVAGRRTLSALTAGGVNPLTRKRYQGDQYQSSTIAHGNAVVHGFYEFWIGHGAGPVINPMPRERVRGQRAHAHHNPLESYEAGGRLRYNPRTPRRRPRAIPDDLWLSLFGALRCNRDRAIVALDVSTGARAAELLGMVAADIDWGRQLIRVRRKGTGAQQWLPVSPEAFVWLRLYLAELSELRPSDPVWQTRRRRRDGSKVLRRIALTYDAWRAVLRQVNEMLGTNWTMHDLRHTCAIRMVRDKRLSLRDVQVILGHAHLSTTQAYQAVFQDELIRSYRSFVDARRTTRPAEEYREPTDAEWAEFQHHFQLRKLELGTCGRPYASPCQHEHACFSAPRRSPIFGCALQ